MSAVREPEKGRPGDFAQSCRTARLSSKRILPQTIASSQTLLAVQTTRISRMGVSYRMFLVDESDRLYRLAVSKFDAMLRNATKHRYPLFAGQRVRAADVVVQLVGLKPKAILRMTFHMLTFDQAGCLDSDAFRRQESSRAEVALAPALSAFTTEVGADAGVVDAAGLLHGEGFGFCRGRWSALSMTSRWAGRSARGCECQTMLQLVAIRVTGAANGTACHSRVDASSQESAIVNCPPMADPSPYEGTWSN